jgi:outer membrane receptor protein involved in Fe transport
MLNVSQVGIISAASIHRKFVYVRIACVCFMLIIIAHCYAGAQTLTGSIAGVVSDSTGASIPSATITANSTALIKGTVATKSDPQGYFKFLELPPGTYSVKVEVPGFTSFVANGIIVNSAITVSINPKLSIGELTQVEIVDGGAVTIDTENVASQQVLSQQELEGIPTGRNPWAAANLVPAVVPNSRDVGGSTGMQAATMVAHGSNVADQRFMIDGVNVTWAGSNGGATAIYYDQGMFQEVNYRVGALPADVGPSGVYMNMITKDGGNRIHGNIFANGAGQGMQSSNVDAALAAKLRKNITNSGAANNPNLVLGNPTTINYDYNGQIGGPLLHDRLWYFGSFRWWKVNNIVSGAFNPNGDAAINDNLIANEMAKFSYQLGAKNKFSGMYSRNQKNRYHRRNTPPYFVPDKAAWLQNQPGSTIIAKWVYTPSTRWVIDTGAGYTHIKYPQRYQPSVTASDISVTDSTLSTLANAAQYSYVNPTWRLSLNSSASALLNSGFGTHSLRVGFEYTHDYFAQIYTENGNLQAIFNNGVPQYAGLATTPIHEQNNLMNTLSFYGQDSWKLGNRLTLDLGLRYEWLVGSIPAQTSPTNPWLNIINGTSATTRSFAAQSDVPNWKYWTPRLGVSWDITGRGHTVIKASFSKYMQGAGMNLLTNINPLQYFTNNVPWSDLDGDGLPEYYSPGDSRNEFNPAAGSGFAKAYVQDPGLRRPNSWEQSVGVQQKMPYDFILSVSGWHRSTSDLIGRYNASVPSSGYTPVTITNPATGKPVTVYNQTAATAPLAVYHLFNTPQLNYEYRGLDVSVQKNLSHRFVLSGGATWSRLRGAVTGDLNTSLDDFNNPNYNINRIGSYPSYDTPVQLKFSGVYKLPYRFDLSGDFQHATGSPVTETYTLSTAIIGQTLHQSQSIIALPYGSIRLSDINLSDLRIARTIKFKDRFTFKPEFDVYNLTNSAAITAVNQSLNNSSLSQNPTTVLPPRLYKIGAQFEF